MNAVSAIIVLEWLFTLIGALVFLAFYGRPWKYSDKVMSWHLASVTAVGGLEIVGLLMARWSLIPSVVAYGLATAIIYWRLGLLLAAQRRARQKAPD